MAGRRSVARWRDWIEWQQVHAGLFSSEIDEQLRAVSRVALWRSRGDVPISVNATAQLVEIALHESLAGGQHHAVGVSARSHMELSLLYATAIVRCVNGLVDGSQKGTYAMAVSALAQRIGIPLWIVDLRHESTHNQLPSLPVLRFAANHLLAWLRTNYWSKQEEVIRSQVRQLAASLIHRLPLSTATAEEQQDDAMVPKLVDAVDADKLRDIIVPLLVHGHQYGECVLPTGALFLDEYLVPESSTTEADTLTRYPKDELIAMVLELQAQWRGLSACLLAATCQRVMHAGGDTPAVIEAAMFWIKLLISNEWRERLKYAEGPIEDIYTSGASMVALCDRLEPSDAIDRLRAMLKTCKGVRTHAILSRHASIRKQLDDPSRAAWCALTEWNATPLGQQNGFAYRELDVVVELPGVDSLPSDKVSDSDGDLAALLATLDAEYTQGQSELMALQQSVADHIVRGGHDVTTRKVLPAHEVERIQNQIEIW